MREASTLTLWFDVSHVRLLQVVRFRSCNVRSNVVDNDRNTQAMLAAKDVLEEGSFAGALESISYGSHPKYLQDSIRYSPRSQIVESLARSEVSYVSVSS